MMGNVVWPDKHKIHILLFNSQIQLLKQIMTNTNLLPPWLSNWTQLRESKLTENPTQHCGGVHECSSHKYNHSVETWRHMRRWTLCHRGQQGTAKTPHDVHSVRGKAVSCSESIIHIVTCARGTGEERVNKREQASLNCLAFGILQVQRNLSIKWNIGKWNEDSLETGRETESQSAGESVQM